MFAEPEVAGRQGEVVNKLRTVRPVIETGCVRGVPAGMGCTSPGVLATGGALRAAGLCSAGRDTPLLPAAPWPSRYEFMVLVRCLLDGVTPEQILADWHPILEERMASYGLDRAEVCYGRGLEMRIPRAGGPGRAACRGLSHA